MTRHGRNSTASAVYTYHERRKDAKQSGYGKLEERLSKDSLTSFDCCHLTLQPAKDPVVTPEGVVYDKAAILEYILHAKKQNAKKLKVWEKDMAERAERGEVVKAEQQAKAVEQLKMGAAVTSPTIDRLAGTSDESNSVSNMVGKKRKELPSFWIPEICTVPKKAKLDDDNDKPLPKPSSKVCCPVTGNPIAFKDLVTIKFTPLLDDDKRKDVGKQHRYMCTVTRDALTNATPCVVLKKSGSVITKECYEKLVRPEWMDPVAGVTMTEDDVIVLRMGGTGFATTNEHLRATSSRPAAQLQ